MLYSMNGSVVGLVKIDDMVSRFNDVTVFFLPWRTCGCMYASWKTQSFGYHFEYSLQEEPMHDAEGL